MARSLDENGAQFLQNGETSQSLSLSDLFQLKDGRVTPVLKAINPPVRANVLHLAPEHAIPIHCYERRFDELTLSVELFHLQMLDLLAFMFHASHHVIPVSATEEEVNQCSWNPLLCFFLSSQQDDVMMGNQSKLVSQIESEAKAVENVAKELCPLSIILDRVVLTSTGVLLGCWQVISGTDPVVLRNRLRTALPRAPDKQLYDVAILHTSFARLLGRPENLPEGKRGMSELQLFHELVDELNSKIQGVKAKVTELWYVEEYDVLALALDGRMKARKFKLGCLRP
ncbi:hypothetical protein Leryth_004580 [Lithospermum erythrorhizon]|nr:hypothetical protein Leryth_004580 [Lithospermum erythrorhizon]